MELEIYEAFISAGVKEDKAKAAVESINKKMKWGQTRLFGRAI